MVQIKNPLSGGGSGGSADIVNGIIEQYKASSGTIDANTFVEFVNSATPGVGVPTEIATGVSTSGLDDSSAVQLGEDIVFVAYKASGGIYGIICRIVGKTITTGASTLIESGNIGQHNVALKAGDNRVLLVYMGTATNSLTAVACQVSEDLITAGTSVLLSSTTNAGYGPNTLENINGEFIVSYPQGSNYYLYAKSIWLSGSSGLVVNSSTAITVASVYNAGSSGKAMCQIGDGYGVFIYTYRPSSSSSARRLYGQAFSVSASHTVTLLGDATDLTGTSTSNAFSIFGAVPIQDKRVFVGFYLIYSKVLLLSFDGTVLSAEAPVQVGADTTLGIVGPLGDNSVIRICWLYTSSGVLAEKYIIEDSSITLVNTTTIVTGLGSGWRNVSIANGRSDSFAFVMYGAGTGSTLTATLTDVSNDIWIDEAKNSTGIGGLTATACTDTTAGDVWVLDTGESE